MYNDAYRKLCEMKLMVYREGYDDFVEKQIMENFDFPRWASHIRSRRRTQKMTTRGMGKAIGLSGSQYSRWENMKSMPTVPDFLYICWMHDLNPMDYFLPPVHVKKTELMLIAAEMRDWKSDEPPHLTGGSPK